MYACVCPCVMSARVCTCVSCAYECVRTFVFVRVIRRRMCNMYPCVHERVCTCDVYTCVYVCVTYECRDRNTGTWTGTPTRIPLRHPTQHREWGLCHRYCQEVQTTLISPLLTGFRDSSVPDYRLGVWSQEEGE